MPYNTGITYDRMDIDSTSPLKLFEYMASARPVVTSDIPVVSKIVKHGESAMLAEPNNIEMLSEYVLQLLNHKEKAATISKEAYKLVKQYSWTKRCEIIHSKLVSGHLPAI
jgi:glycosyltransferase involved in cell wall biosynthesis